MDGTAEPSLASLLRLSSDTDERSLVENVGRDEDEKDGSCVEGPAADEGYENEDGMAGG
jgi:hypothetical protein